MIDIYIQSIQSQLKRQMTPVKSVSYKGQGTEEGEAKMSAVINVITYTSELHSNFFSALQYIHLLVLFCYGTPHFRQIIKTSR